MNRHKGCLSTYCRACYGEINRNNMAPKLLRGDTPANIAAYFLDLKNLNEAGRSIVRDKKGKLYQIGAGFDIPKEFDLVIKANMYTRYDVLTKALM